MTTVKLLEYTANEMVDILVDKRIMRADASQMVDVYLERRRFAKAKYLRPAPCFRDLLRLQPILLPVIFQENGVTRKRKEAFMMQLETAEQKRPCLSLRFFHGHRTPADPMLSSTAWKFL